MRTLRYLAFLIHIFFFNSKRKKIKYFWKYYSRLLNLNIFSFYKYVENNPPEIEINKCERKDNWVIYAILFQIDGDF